MPVSETNIVNLTPVILKPFEVYIRDESEQEIWFYVGLKVLLGLK